jgi:Zn-dependent peptidase ImmA (M78 family)
MTIRRKYVQSQADSLLKKFNVKHAPVPVEKIAKSMGAIVQRVPADDSLSGFIYHEKASRTTVIGVNASHALTRQHFTLGHELGHFVLHNIEDVHVDRGFSVRLRNATSSEGKNVEEVEANLFAAELLMPASFLDKDIQAIDYVDLDDESTIADLANKYSVSTQAMIFRLAYLNYIRQ